MAYFGRTPAEDEARPNPNAEGDGIPEEMWICVSR